MIETNRFQIFNPDILRIIYDYRESICTSNIHAQRDVQKYPRTTLHVNMITIDTISVNIDILVNEGMTLLHGALQLIVLNSHLMHKYI